MASSDSPQPPTELSLTKTSNDQHISFEEERDISDNITSVLPTTSTDPTPKAKELVDLSNETLSRIVCNLDAPSAVCLGLTCKQLMSLVTTVCNRDLVSIVPKYAYSDQGTPAVLDDYTSTIIVNRLFRDIDRALHTCYDIGLGQVVAGQKQYSLKRIGLLNQFNYNLYGSHLLEGHDRCCRPNSSTCVICGLLGLMDGSYRRGRSDMLKELEETGEVTYDDDDDDDEEGQAGDLDDDADDSDDEDSDESDHGPDDEDGGAAEESNLHNGDSSTIRSESERSVDEDGEVNDGANEGNSGIYVEMDDVDFESEPLSDEGDTIVNGTVFQD